MKGEMELKMANDSAEGVIELCLAVPKVAKMGEQRIEQEEEADLMRKQQTNQRQK